MLVTDCVGLFLAWNLQWIRRVARYFTRNVHLANSEVGGCCAAASHYRSLRAAPSCCFARGHLFLGQPVVLLCFPLQVAQFIIMNRTQCRTLSRLQELQARGVLGWCAQVQVMREEQLLAAAAVQHTVSRPPSHTCRRRPAARATPSARCLNWPWPCAQLTSHQAATAMARRGREVHPATALGRRRRRRRLSQGRHLLAEPGRAFFGARRFRLMHLCCPGDGRLFCCAWCLPCQVFDRFYCECSGQVGSPQFCPATPSLIFIAAWTLPLCDFHCPSASPSESVALALCLLSRIACPLC